ncbi:hypothetical protein [Paraburkholderia hospita]|uniref:hypothetical protein n=1 Tax=Paraburkholderia TaxID=1822464 RepID=UPI000B346EAA|nr:hypothetical protein [Paraburkholderia hospita]OUL80850.1 hypothetical protein CA601_32105 [Paraburkholderia hospita]
MAARETSSLFHVAERAVVALYDGGVLSPAVLQRVLQAFIGTKVKWETETEIRSVDGHTFRDIVVSTLMPGHVPEVGAREFARIMAHLGAVTEAAGKARSKSAKAPTKHETGQDREERSDDDDALIDQLGVASRPKRRTDKEAPARKGTSAPSSGSGLSTGFNPLLNPKIPRKR